MRTTKTKTTKTRKTQRYRASHAQRYVTINPPDDDWLIERSERMAQLIVVLLTNIRNKADFLMRTFRESEMLSEEEFTSFRQEIALGLEGPIEQLVMRLADYEEINRALMDEE